MTDNTQAKQEEKKAEAEKAAQDKAANKPLDPASHENDPSLTDKEKAERDKGKAYVDTSAGQRTSDSDDEYKGWTVQQRDVDDDPIYIEERLGEPGQKFHWHELPEAKSVEKFGVDSSVWPQALPLHEDAEKNVDKNKVEKKEYAGDAEKRAAEKTKTE